MVVGLYLVVWGKSKEQKRLMPPSPEKEITLQLPVTVPRNDSNDDNYKAQLVVIGDKNSDVEATRSSTESQSQ